MKEQTHNSKTDRAARDNVIWLIVQTVITAISIIYWAEWAGDEVRRYNALDQGSFIHLIVIPWAVSLLRAKLWLNSLTYIFIWPRSILARCNTHRLLWDGRPAVWGRTENMVSKVHPNYFFSSVAFCLSASHTHWTAGEDIQEKIFWKGLNFTSWLMVHYPKINQVSCVWICPLVGGLCVYAARCCIRSEAAHIKTAGCVHCASTAPYPSMPQCAVIALLSAVRPMKAKWVTGPIKGS